MATTLNATPPNFESVWAILQENAIQKKETDRKMQETDQQMKEPDRFFWQMVDMLVINDTNLKVF